MIGPILIVTGLFWMWVVFKGKSGAMWDAITGNGNFASNLDAKANAVAPSTGSGGSGGGGGGSSSGNGVSANSSDSGTHMGIDSNGNIITINSSYADMTSSQKDAANAFAHQIGNVG